MTLALGFYAALGFGAADFLARYAVHRVGPYRSLIFMELLGLAVLTVYILLSGDLRHALVPGSGTGWIWTVLVTLGEVACTLALYRAFERGVLSIVAPISASFAAVTVVLSVLSGEVLTVQRDIGIALSLIGVVLASTPSHSSMATADGQSKHLLPPGVGLAIASAAGFGVVFWLLGFQVTPRMGSVIPVWANRLLGPPVFALLALRSGQSLAVPDARDWQFIAGVAVLDTTGYLATTAALRGGHVAIVGVLISLFSTVTVLLAWIFLRERLTPLQWLGVGVIFIGVALVSV